MPVHRWQLNTAHRPDGALLSQKEAWAHPSVGGTQKHEAQYHKQTQTMYHMTPLI